MYEYNLLIEYSPQFKRQVVVGIVRFPWDRQSRPLVNNLPYNNINLLY